MRDILKELNDRGPCEIRVLDEHELRRFEALCESWARIAEAEVARRNALPRGQLQPRTRGSIAGPSADGRHYFG
jgi:hypothetical protein